jgi:hypothetical protein
VSNEATVFSLTTTEMATGVANQADNGNVDVATTDADVMTSSVDIGLYYLKAAYEGTDGRSKLLRHLKQIEAKIIKSAWPPV